MPWAGGVYSLPAGTSVSAGNTIESSWANALTQDLESALNTDTPVAAGGTGASTPAGARTNLEIPGHTRTAKTADFSVTTGDNGKLFAIDASSNTVTATLPAAATAGDGFIVGFRADDVTNAVTIDADGSESIDGTATRTLSDIGQVVWLRCDGTGWVTLAQGGTLFDGFDKQVFRRMSSDQLTTSTTAADVTDLGIAVKSGDTWHFEIVMILIAGTSTNLAVSLNGPTTSAFGAHSIISRESTDTNVSTDIGAYGTIGINTGTGSGLLTVQCNATFSADGTFVPRISRSSGSAPAAARGGSKILGHRIG